MGYDICWNEHGECEELPDKFTRRVKGHRIFQSHSWSLDNLTIRTCSCKSENHVYMCDGIDDYRPKDANEFNKWREAIKTDPMCQESLPIFLEMIDYLERNLNMYLNFSC